MNLITIKLNNKLTFTMLSQVKTKRNKPFYKRIRKTLGFVCIGLFAPIFLLPSAFSLPQSQSSLIINSPKEVVDEVWQIIYRDYLDSSGIYDNQDWIALRRKLLSEQYFDRRDSHEAIRAMLATLEDPYTRFLNPKEFREMRIDTTGELMGVGIQISLDEETKELIVVSPIEGTPAYKAGIKPKDVIVSIDENSTKGMSIDNAVKLIRGKKGTEVTLGLQRNDQFIKIQLIRARIEINAVETKVNLTNEGFKLGYIRLKQFNANSVREMRFAIKNLEQQNVLGYILDLRGNPGGLLEASIEISRQWLDEGVIVSTKTRDGINDVRRAKGISLTSRPLAVLVNEGSASASEILSGAIQDNKRGILVGTKTFGKGLVQSVRGLSDGSGLTVTIAKYLTPKGKDIHKNGIYPDINVSLLKSDLNGFTKSDLATSRDKQYKVAENELVRLLKKRAVTSIFDPLSSNYKNVINMI